MKNRTLFLLYFFILLCGLRDESLSAVVPRSNQTEFNSNTEDDFEARYLASYMLPEDHPFQENLKSMFTNKKMFQSISNFRKAGFKVKEANHGLMLGSHPSNNDYLIKIFNDGIPRSKQLDNFIKRIEGAEVLRAYIAERNFTHVVVPKKWLYRLPPIFSKLRGKAKYILIVENMHILGGGDNRYGENRKKYLEMDKETVKELTTVLHDVGGCDAYPRNQPFTESGKIAFVDTEHIGVKEKEMYFFTHTVRCLNREMQEYALALWDELENQ